MILKLGEQSKCNQPRNLGQTWIEVSMTYCIYQVNQHEPDFMVELCRYLLMQGYEPDQITILTAYVGKSFKLLLIVV